MNTEVFKSKTELGVKSAKDAENKIRNAIEKNGSANIILATGASQFETLKNLVTAKEIDWSKVVMFHLDEYVGLTDQHPASFRKYLKERFVDKVGDLKAVHFIRGESQDVEAECERLNGIISQHLIDVALVGIGENGHLAFNDPPADFDTEEPYIVVELDEACRKQQMGEGWFETFDDVPQKAISMSVKQILKSKYILCSVPDKRKAKAVKNCLAGEISNMYPASILQKHAGTTIYLDQNSNLLLSKKS
jgi:glucosamine-6-phosphate deaminase